MATACISTTRGTRLRSVTTMDKGRVEKTTRTSTHFWFSEDPYCSFTMMGVETQQPPRNAMTLQLPERCEMPNAFVTRRS